MIALTLGELAAVTGGRVIGDPDLRIVSIATDSRQVPPTSLFVALATAHADGHDYIEDARRSGAVAALTQKAGDVPDPQRPSVVVSDTWAALRQLAAHVRQRVAPTSVAITGSVGKTTAKDLIAAATAVDRRVHAARGSFNNELGVPLTLLGLEVDDEVLVAEVGARHEGDIAALAPLLAPDVAVVTAVAAVHLEIFGSVDAIARAKGELVDALGPNGLAVLHGADPRVAAMADRAPDQLFVAIDPARTGPPLDVWAEEIHLDRRARPSAVAVTPWGRIPLQLPVAGRHQLLHGLFAVAVAGHLGVDLGRAAAAVATAEVSPGRGAVDDLGGIVLLDDAYNANPTSVGAALETLVAVQRTGATVAVLGEMAEIGPGSSAEHEAMGRRCAELGVDRLVVVGANAAPLAAGARGAGLTEVVEVPDARAAAARVLAEIAPGDVVLIKASRVAGLDQVGEALRAALGGSPRDGADHPNAGPSSSDPSAPRRRA